METRPPSPAGSPPDALAAAAGGRPAWHWVLWVSAFALPSCAFCYALRAPAAVVRIQRGSVPTPALAPASASSAQPEAAAEDAPPDMTYPSRPAPPEEPEWRDEPEPRSSPASPPPVARPPRLPAASPPPPTESLLSEPPAPAPDPPACPAEPTPPSPGTPPPVPLQPRGTCIYCGAAVFSYVEVDGRRIGVCPDHYARVEPPARPRRERAGSSEPRDGDAAQCRGATRSGPRCRRKTRDPSGLCYQHRR